MQHATPAQSAVGFNLSRVVVKPDLNVPAEADRGREPLVLPFDRRISRSDLFACERPSPCASKGLTAAAAFSFLRAPGGKSRCAVL